MARLLPIRVFLLLPLQLKRLMNILPPTPVEREAAFWALRISLFVHCVMLSTSFST